MGKACYGNIRRALQWRKELKEDAATDAAVAFTESILGVVLFAIIFAGRTKQEIARRELNATNTSRRKEEREMAIKHVCDRCSECLENGQGYDLQISKKDTYGTLVLGKEICEDCLKELKEWIEQDGMMSMEEFKGWLNRK